MNNRRSDLSWHLEGRLRDLGTSFQVPPVPDLAETVRGRIEGPAPSRLRPTARLVLAAAVLLAAVGAGVVLFSSSTRQAVANWLGIRGVEIVEEAPGPRHVTDGRLLLGRKASLEEARGMVPFGILLPAGVGRPDEVYVAVTAYGGRAVSLVYGAGGALPPAAGTRVGLLITQWQAGIRDDLMQKVRTHGVEVEAVPIGRSPAYWISGDPHYVFLLDPSGGVIEDRTRLAGDTLLWERGQVSLRLESGLGKADALRIARSMRAP
ncbi:MAG: hypothetical protein M3333_08395 [Actinomycetota bacterium]|nr:hypothetical protein [Actinomycetota bacterium]